MTDIETLIREDSIRIVPADPTEAQALLAAASAHLVAAPMIMKIDRVGAYVLAYDAARKSITAHMIHHGYDPRSGTGSHQSVGEYGETLGRDPFGSFDRMRRNRNRSQYGSRNFGRSEVEADIAAAHRHLRCSDQPAALSRVFVSPRTQSPG